MSEIQAIQFTQEQVRTLTGVSVETIRHWRKSVPYLATRSGKSARYTFADILGLAVTREVISAFGVSIVKVSVGIEALFLVLAESRPTVHDETTAVVTANTASLCSVEDTLALNLDGPALIVPMGPLIARIQHSMLPAAAKTKQAALPFPPQVVSSGP